MNQVNLIGRLTKDPTISGEGDKRVARFNLAINEGYGDKEKVNYPSIIVFGKQAEICEKYLSKGKLVAVSGRIQTGSYTNKEGATVYTTDVVAGRVEFLSPASNSGEGTPNEVPSEFQELEEDLPW